MTIVSLVTSVTMPSDVPSGATVRPRSRSGAAGRALSPHAGREPVVIEFCALLVPVLFALLLSEFSALVPSPLLGGGAEQAKVNVRNAQSTVSGVFWYMMSTTRRRLDTEPGSVAVGSDRSGCRSVFHAANSPLRRGDQLRSSRRRPSETTMCSRPSNAHCTVRARTAAGSAPSSTSVMSSRRIPVRIGWP